MSLGLRFSLAISLLVVLVSLGLSVSVRRALESLEQRQFTEQLQAATTRLKLQLEQEVAELPTIVRPLCEHGELVNSALMDLERGGGQLPVDREYPLSRLTTETRKSLGFDEMILFTQSGKVLGAHEPQLIGTTIATLGVTHQSSQRARLERSGKHAQLAAHCIKFSGQFGVGVWATRHFKSIIDPVSEVHGIDLRLSASPSIEDEVAIELTGLDNLTVYANPQRDALDSALAELNKTIIQWAAVTLIIALIVGLVFARRLARPIEQLALQAARAPFSDPLPVSGRGSTELRQLAASFNRAIADLAKLRKRLSLTERIAAQREIARRVAHEIKNPLAPIQAAVETLRRLRRRNDAAFDEYFEEATSTVLNEVKRISNIVTTFTEFARLPEPRLEPVEVEPVLRSVINLHRSSDTAITLRVGDSLTVRADRDQLVQVVTNLLQNALEAVKDHPVGTGQVDVVAQAGQLPQGGRSSLVLTVEDNGPGVPEAIRSRLFAPYVTSKTGGTGLGLAIVQQIVVEHGGEITHESTTTGTRFTVHLPVDGPISAVGATDLDPSSGWPSGPIR